jgi:hypothetical protein
VDRGVGRRAFRAVVPAEVFAMPVAIVLSVGVVVPFVVGKRIGERETIVRGQEIDRTAVLAEDVR